MAGEQLPFRVDRGADRLRDAEHDAAGQRAPEQPRPPMITASKAKISRAGPDRRIEIGAHAEKQRGDRADREREAHRDREQLLVVDAHQLRGDGIVGDGAKRAAQRGAIEELVERDDDGDGGDEASAAA